MVYLMVHSSKLFESLWTQFGVYLLEDALLPMTTTVILKEDIIRAERKKNEHFFKECGYFKIGTK